MSYRDVHTELREPGPPTAKEMAFLVYEAQKCREAPLRMNWVEQVHAYYARVAREFSALLASRVADGQARTLAHRRAANLLMVSSATMRNRLSVLNRLDPRVVELARSGGLTAPGALEFVGAWPATPRNTMPTEVVTEVLAAMRFEDGTYPRPATPEYIRNAIRKVRIRSLAPTVTVP